MTSTSPAGEPHATYIAAMKSFVFTDIESSTRLWEDDPEAMSAALQRHFEVLTVAVEAESGRILKSTGDGIIAVFDQAPNAVAATLAGQRALTTETWSTPGPIRVRMGIHAGEAQVGEDDFFGPVLNRAARIMAAGHGGQVMTSSAVADLVGASVPEGASLLDLGVHRLKDLTEPEHLYQLVHPDLKRDFPAPLTLESSPNNLPYQTTEFLGRDNELNTIETMLMAPGTRLVTIAGPGGAGKTRLGLQVAAELAHRFADGVYFVELAAEGDADSAFEAVIRALDLPTSSGDPLDVLRSNLVEREMLLLLDNFEQITEAGPGVVALLQSCPGLKTLVTSRETLRVRGEHVFPVPPMGLPDPRDPMDEIAQAETVMLFTNRARSVRPDFALTPDNAPMIAQICLRLDGLPLAIELAAARMSLFTPETLLQRLQDRLDVLGGGGRDLPDRQRTLWGAISWSYELLDEAERRAFEMMSVFSSARLEAIEAVASQTLGSIDLFETMASLVDKSLIRSDDLAGDRRFSMLLMIKEFAAERLADVPEFSQQVRRAHADYFCRFTIDLNERLNGPERQQVLDELGMEIGNLRTSWGYWVETGDVEQIFQLIDGLWALHDAKGWYHAAIELASDALRVLTEAGPSPELAAEELTLRTGLARALMAVRGYDVEVEDAFKKVLEMTEQSGDVSLQTPVLRSLATFYQQLGKMDEALVLGRRVLAVAEQEQDPSLLAEGRFLTGAALAFSGESEEGLAILEEAIASSDAITSSVDRFRVGPNTAVSTLVAAGMVHWQIGAIDLGISRVARSLDVAEDLEHPFSVAYALYHNGFLALGRNRFDEARDFALRLRVVSTENDYALWGTLSTVLEGVASTFLGYAATGLKMTETGIELYQGMTTPPIFWPLILHLRGLVHAHAGNPERGLNLVDEAISMLGPDEFPDIRISRADIMRLLPTPDLDDVERCYLSAIDSARTSRQRTYELQAWTRLVDLRRARGVVPDGSDELRVIYDTFTEGFAEHDLVMARTVLGLDPVIVTPSP
jgi:predicted ATPase/class 3 adenylate cyclase